MVASHIFNVKKDLKSNPGSDEACWSVLIRRNRLTQATFFYAVTTTGIYCRPGCPARLPKREHVEFFESCDDAQRAGYRACKRCRPNARLKNEDPTQLITEACRRLEREDPPPTFKELAAVAGKSPWHFHRLFKATVGITPKQYVVMHRMQRFSTTLRTNGSITEAIYEAGFGASSRANAEALSWFKMKPSAFKRGAAGHTICYSTGNSFLGPVVVAATKRGVCAIEFLNRVEEAADKLKQRFPNARIEMADKSFSSLVQQVIAFIATPEQELGLPLDIRGTAFQQRVWLALREIPIGATLSYATVAERIGKPRAVRAVAQACASNRLAVAIPCHRVVRSDGALSGYRWGIERKCGLLQREYEICSASRKKITSHINPLKQSIKSKKA